VKLSWKWIGCAEASLEVGKSCQNDWIGR